MELLTHEEYRAMAAEMDFATAAFVDGGYRPALSGETFETLNPATGDKLADVAACAAQDVDF
jgi:gamma-glutamyl-gamma-aminobutyraldehyde dehydrogenase